MKTNYMNKHTEDYETCTELKLKDPMKMAAPVAFKTHPNAPVVINRFRVRHGKKFHNRNPWFAKYASAEGAEWMCKTMNSNSDFNEVWYIVK